MKIAIIGPSPVPYTIGGVENLLWGLISEINQNTPHQVELIKLPSREDNFWNIIETYKKFYELDLRYFDMVISTKYPAWMVQHANHICYLQHRLRGLYDTYHFCKQPLEVDRNNSSINEIVDYIEHNKHNKSLDEFFGLMDKLMQNKNNIPEQYFSFPGPFIRKIVHYMDDFALGNNRIKEFYCISNTVKNRREYFPGDVIPKVVHHPSFLKRYESREYKHIFIVSRLDAPKRIDLMIRAMEYIKEDIDLIIAGTGPQEEYLKDLANEDKRIKFVGFVTDEEIENLYRDSLVIPYFPYDEDYGLITIEAMMHKKPVITTFDAGGPTEFVKDYYTGFVVATEPKAIAEKINYFIHNVEEAKKMGLSGYNQVKDITWEYVISNILSSAGVKAKSKDRKKITLTSTFPIYPPQGGGQVRTYNICKHLANSYDIEIVSFTGMDQPSFNGYIAPHLYETRIPKTLKHQEEESNIERRIGVNVGDIAIPIVAKYTPDYAKVLKQSIKNSDLVIVSHPYLVDEVKKVIEGKPFIYDAQDVEYLIKKELLPHHKHSEELLKKIYKLEKMCCEQSEFIMTCSAEDKLHLCNLYKIEEEKVIVVPNGVDVFETKFTSFTQRAINKRKMGINGQKVGMFMGSWHPPNIEACKYIFKIAQQCPDIVFLLIGSQCLYFDKKEIPSNVGMLGVISEEVKSKIFETVDFALNPMTSGSGTNLKMFDYMAAGIPIITTEFGTRGIEDKSLFNICGIEEMGNVINENKINNYTEEQRRYVEKEFDWEKIVQNFKDKVNKLVEY